MNRSRGAIGLPPDLFMVKQRVPLRDNWLFPFECLGKRRRDPDLINVLLFRYIQLM